MLMISINLAEHNRPTRSASFHVCSEECIPTAVKMSLMTAKESQIMVGSTSSFIMPYSPNQYGPAVGTGLQGLIDDSTQSTSWGDAIHSIKKQYKAIKERI